MTLQDIYHISASIFYIIAIFAVLWVVITLLRVWWYESKINKKYESREEEIRKAQNRHAPVKTVEGQIDQIKRSYRPEIEKLERKRKFILEKIPFINIFT